MHMNSYKFKYNCLSYEKLHKYLKYTDKFFEPNLSSYVQDLRAYAKKIHNNALIIEAYKYNKLVGLLAIYLNSSKAFITHFCVVPSERSKGLGRILFTLAVENAQKHSCKSIELECYTSNTKAQNFYLKQGMKIIKQNNDKLLLEYILPIVTINCVTYNQAKYIKQCLDGFLMQKTNFPFEVLIHDDASLDGTKEIIEEYTRKYPDIIKPIYEKENQYSKGVSISKTYNFPRVKGKYVAMCEGDDYWTDEYKLQKQVDFMEANHDYTICFHPVKRVFETKIRENDTFPTADMIDAGFTFENLLKYNFIQTNSVMYRWEAVKDVAKNFPANILPGDWYLHTMFAKEGKIKFINEVMSVYRINSGGIWYDEFVSRNKLYEKYCCKMMNFYKYRFFKLVKNKNYKAFKYYLYCNFKYIKQHLNFKEHKLKYVRFLLENTMIYLCFVYYIMKFAMFLYR